jgi:hypothetical protein
LKRSPADPGELRRPLQILFRKINVALLIAAVEAPRLKDGEANGIHSTIMIVGFDEALFLCTDWIEQAVQEVNPRSDFRGAS